MQVGEKPRTGLVITLPDGAQGMQAPRVEIETDADGKFGQIRSSLREEEIKNQQVG